MGRSDSSLSDSNSNAEDHASAVSWSSFGALSSSPGTHFARKMIHTQSISELPEYQTDEPTVQNCGGRDIESSSGVNWLLGGGGKPTGSASKSSSGSLLSQSNLSVNGNYWYEPTEPTERKNTANNYATFGRPATAMLSKTYSQASLSKTYSQASLRSRPSVPTPKAQPPLDILSQSVETAVAPIYGIYGCEVWMFNEQDGTLVNMPITQSLIPSVSESSTRRAPGNLYMRSPPQEADHDSPSFDSVARDAFERLVDTTRLDFMPLKTLDPGVGLAGLLWAEQSTMNGGPGIAGDVGQKVRERVVNLGKGLFSRLDSVSSSEHDGHDPLDDPLDRKISHSSLLDGLEPVKGTETFDVKQSNGLGLVWRDVEALSEDPDQPFIERMQFVAKAGMTLVTGVQYDVNGGKGIVVFFANPHSDPKRLRNRENSQLIQLATQFIGSSCAMCAPLKKAAELVKRRPRDNWRRVRHKILGVVRLYLIATKNRDRSGYRGSPGGSPLLRRNDSSFDLRSTMKRTASTLSLLTNREQSYKLLTDVRNQSFRVLSEATTTMKSKLIQKSIDVKLTAKAKGMKFMAKVQHGGHAGLPPPFTWNQTVWTFTGVAITHSILSLLDYYIVTLSGGSHQLILGPLGALTTLQYNLTAAPASQPRNCLYAQIIAISTCSVLHRFESLNRFQRAALAPTIVNTVTAKLGIIHPPSGAAAAVFAYQKFSQVDELLFLLGVVISTFIAVIINNLSDRRQYPSTSWAVFKVVFS